MKADLDLAEMMSSPGAELEQTELRRLTYALEKLAQCYSIIGSKIISLGHRWLYLHACTAVPMSSSLS